MIAVCGGTLESMTLSMTQALYANAGVMLFGGSGNLQQLAERLDVDVAIFDQHQLQDVMGIQDFLVTGTGNLLALYESGLVRLHRAPRHTANSAGYGKPAGPDTSNNAPETGLIWVN
jgi:hypothetical protein